jgi:hypothetical protein
MYKIIRDADIKTLVTTSYHSLAGPPSVPETYLFSKELVAYLKTLIAFSVYYRAMTPACLGRWISFTQRPSPATKTSHTHYYAEFHKYITRKLDNRYRLFQFKKNNDAAEDDSFSGEAGDIVEVPAVDASKEGLSFHMSDGEEQEAEADNVAAVEAAEARLADGPAAGSAAVAAAGAGEVASASAGSQAYNACCEWQ